MYNEIKIIDSEMLDRIDVNTFLEKSTNANIFQTPEIAGVYKKSEGYLPLYLAAINDSSGEILSMLLANVRILKEGQLSRFATFSTSRGGPVFLNDAKGLGASRLLLNHYEKIVIKKNALYTRAYMLEDLPNLSSLFVNTGWVFEDSFDFLIDLKQPIDLLWRNIHKSRRKGINRAGKRGVIIEEISKKSILPKFYDLYIDMCNQANIIPQKSSLFESVFDMLVPKTMAKIFMARYDKEYVAGRIALTYKGRIYDWFAGSSAVAKSLYANELLVWHILKWGSENHYNLFDFGGAGTPGKLEGIREFKRRFGGQFVNVGRYKKIHSPKKLWLSENIYKLHKRISRR